MSDEQQLPSNLQKQEQIRAESEAIQVARGQVQEATLRAIHNVTTQHEQDQQPEPQQGQPTEAPEEQAVVKKAVAQQIAHNISPTQIAALPGTDREKAELALKIKQDQQTRAELSDKEIKALTQTPDHVMTNARSGRFQYDQGNRRY